MVNIAHLRNQFKPIKTLAQIYEIYHNIDMVKKNPIVSFWGSKAPYL